MSQNDLVSLGNLLMKLIRSSELTFVEKTEAIQLINVVDTLLEKQETFVLPSHSQR